MKWSLAAVIILSAIGASASVVATNRNTTWEQAQTINLADGPAVLFGVLGSTGDARFYRLSVDKPMTVDATLDVPIWADARFHPQLVVYQPDSVTVSPSLPLVQPPNTIALVYPLTVRTKHFDRATQISMTERLRVAIELPVAGQYYLAVYNADQQSGRWRLTMADQADDRTPSAWSWPKRWWVAQHWASPSPATVYLPIVLVVIIAVVVGWGIANKRQPTHRSKKKS